jgi:two-component system, OmpR family, sensor histidine kinase ResE
MNSNRLSSLLVLWWRTFDSFRFSIGAKIILPYLFLTLLVAGVGAFVVTNLVTGSLQERFYNQLLDAGRVVSETMVRYETERLAVLRAVLATEGVAESVLAQDAETLAALVPQIIANSQTDGVVLLDGHGRLLYTWQRRSGQQAQPAGADIAAMPEIRQVLDGYLDEFGDKFVLLYESSDGLMLYTVGPIYLEEQLVGAAMVGTLVRPMVVNLTETAVARVTLYDRHGQVVESTLGLGGRDAPDLTPTPEEMSEIAALLRQSSDRHGLVVAGANESVPFSRVEVLGQEYWLAFGDWRLRGQSFGLFAVALPGNFIVNAAVTSRRLLSLVFSLSTIGVFMIGFAVAQRIVRPLNRLVQTSLAVAQGDLQQRSGIRSRDEVGRLAKSFDLMTGRLAERSRQLSEQASKLEAILSSIADGVLVLDDKERVISLNPAARQLLGDFSSRVGSAPLKALTPISEGGNTVGDLEALLNHKDGGPVMSQRYHLGNRVLSALAAPVQTPEGVIAGSVVVLRDITREVEAEELKEGFITSISHELRTPLTAIIGYSQLLNMSAGPKLDDSQRLLLQRINDSGDQLDRHINALINISQLQAGSLALKFERLLLSQLVEQVVERWREPMRAKSLAFDFEPPEEQVWIDGDEHYLLWAAENVLSNAHNYTLPGGQVTVRLYCEAGEARLEVQDTGVGVAAADLSHLFSRFFRASHEATFDVRGVGLGLFIARSVVEMHQGRIWAESTLGVGSVFSLALPLAEAGT